MSTNVLLFGWKRSLPGREVMSAEHFQSFNAYLAGQQQAAKIQSFEVVLLSPYGGEIEGFFLVHGESAQLDTLVASPQWVDHQVRGLLHLEQSMAVRGITGALVAERMGVWGSKLAGLPH